MVEEINEEEGGGGQKKKKKKKKAVHPLCGGRKVTATF